MALLIKTADQRMQEKKTSIAVFGPSAVGKTTLIRNLPVDRTVVLDLEAGMNSVRDWAGPSIEIRRWEDFRDVCVLLSGPDPAVHPDETFGANHHAYVKSQNADLDAFLATRSIVFTDSITDLSRQVMTYAKQQPEAFSEKTGKPDTRGAYGLLGRTVIHALKLLQHAPGKTAIFVGILEKTKDDFGVHHWEPQIEGSKIGRELPGIVDECFTMQFFNRKEDGSVEFSESGTERLLVTRANNPWGFPAKDRSGKLDLVETADLAHIFAKINA